MRLRRAGADSEHLTPAALIDMAEGTVVPATAAHLDRCPRCRREAASVASTLAAIRGDPVAEPSPLFWQHFGERVRRLLDQGDERPAWRRVFHAQRHAVAFAAVAAVVVIAVLVLRPGFDRRPAPVGAPPAPAQKAEAAMPGESADTDWPSPNGDASWLMVQAASAGLDWDEMRERMLVPPGSAERAAADLTGEEQQELVRLLRAEIDHPQ